VTPKRVEQLMSRTVATCRPEDRLDAAARIMWERDCGVVPVTVADDGRERVVGMVTDRDACMAAFTQGRSLGDITVKSVMCPEVRACGPKDSIRTALRVMETGQVHRLPVVDEDGHLVGVLSLADVAQAEARDHDAALADELVRAMERISTPRPHGLAPPA
jgi:CBS domain-containing protein